MGALFQTDPGELLFRIGRRLDRSVAECFTEESYTVTDSTVSIAERDSGSDPDICDT